MLNTAIIILAAGNSSRLGRPKQLLEYQNRTLINNIIDAAIGALPSIVILITGAASDEVNLSVKGKNILIVHNTNWEEGMASSIVLGISTLFKMMPDIDNVIITVCDQPFVTSDFLSNLLSQKNKSKKTIVSSSYADTFGTPVLFDRTHFNALLALRGNEGAKKLLRIQKDEMTSIPLLKGDVDIDTDADYRKLIND